MDGKSSLRWRLEENQDRWWGVSVQEGCEGGRQHQRKNELKCTVGDKSLGLVSIMIDKALGGKLKDEETQLKWSPKYAERANIDLTLVHVTRKRFWTRLSQRKQSQRMSLRRVSQISRCCQRKQWLRRSKRRRWLSRSLLLQNDAAEKGTSQHGVVVNAQSEVLDHLRERMSETDEFLQHGVSAREKQEVLEQLSRVSEQWRFCWKSSWIGRRLLKGR